LVSAVPSRRPNPGRTTALRHRIVNITGPRPTAARSGSAAITTGTAAGTSGSAATGTIRRTTAPSGIPVTTQTAAVSTSGSTATGASLKSPVLIESKQAERLIQATRLLRKSPVLWWICGHTVVDLRHAYGGFAELRSNPTLSQTHFTAGTAAGTSGSAATGTIRRTTAPSGIPASTQTAAVPTSGSTATEANPGSRFG
jgi:hypothetical protein